MTTSHERAEPNREAVTPPHLDSAPPPTPHLEAPNSPTRAPAPKWWVGAVLGGVGLVGVLAIGAGAVLLLGLLILSQA